MNTIDIVSLVLILILVLLGLWRGLLRGIFRLAAWIAAIAGAYFANKLFSAQIIDVLECSSFTAAVICMCIGFLVPFLLLLFTGHKLKNLVSETVVGKVDRILGAIFGLVKAYLILFVVMTIFHILPLTGIVKDTRDEAVTYAAYKASLEAIGYSSEPVDIVDAAERKASELTEKMVNKASEKAEEVAKETVDKATEAAKDAAKDVADQAAKKVVNEIKEPLQKAMPGEQP